MDDKLADYIFFPLSHVFRNQDRQASRVVELSVKISAQLVQQLLVLLTYIIAGVPGKERTQELPEETALEAYKGLTTLIKTTGSSASAATALEDASAIPALGHCVSVILDGVVDGATADIQVQALLALQAVYAAVRSHAAVATFLPGTVSALTKVVSVPAGKKRRVLVSSVQTLGIVLIRVLGDMRTRNIPTDDQAVASEGDKGKVLTASWLSATTSQVKLALSTILKLRTYDSEEVQTALERMCVSLLDECHTSLANCQPILVETAMVLAPESPADPLKDTSLQDLVALYPELGESIKIALYNWTTSLPRVMLSSDEGVKQQAIGRLLRGMKTFKNLEADSSTLEASMTLALRDSVTSLSANDRPKIATRESELWSMSGFSGVNSSDLDYRPILMSHESQVATRKGLLDLLSHLGSPTQQSKLAREMLDFARDSTGPSQISAFWLSYELVKAAIAPSDEIASYIDFSAGIDSEDGPEELFNDLYDFSVTVLDSHTEVSDVDWRMEGLALEITASAASRVGPAFRPELIDVLYPIATFLGSENPLLRDHAIVTLNSVATSCGYSSVSQLIVENADYMVNSISLRLDTFDISPASAKVLTMLVRLTGPKLVPFLDDVVSSVFAALDNYHGYPVLVESLFMVLKEVAEQGAKSDKLLLENGTSAATDHRKRRAEETTIEDILSLLERRKKRHIAHSDFDEDDLLLQSHPKQPWASAKGKAVEQAEDQIGEEDDSAGALEEEKKPPKSPTYALLERIATFTQHYLTSPTPTLRKSLLELLATVSPALSADEDSYLPLVNAIWPVVVARLYDPEPFIVIAACDALCGLCSAAGDFLSTRIKAEWWNGLGKWCRNAKAKAAGKTDGKRLPAGRKYPRGGLGEDGGSGILIPIRSGSGLEARKPTDLAPVVKAVSGGLGRFAQSVQVWEAAVRLLVAVVSYVRIDDEVFDEILDLLVDILGQNQEARHALEIVNPDAVWLAMYQRGEVEWMPAPVVDGISLPPMDRFE
jgi:TELO2-interacting protein 1